MKIKLVLMGVLLLATGIRSYAQSYSTATTDPNVITTAVPFVSIVPDARGGAMGDCGVASEADVFSMSYNPAKYSYLKDNMTVGLGYSPWLRQLAPDMNLGYLVYGMKLNSQSAFAASLRYFDCGDIQFTNANGEDQGTYSPNEWAIDATYSRMLTDYLSGAVTGRFIYSNLTQNQGGATWGWSVAADIGVYYKRPVEWFRDMDADFAWGVSITNLGSKISYRFEENTDREFIPTMLRFGPCLTLELDEYNSLSFMVEATKLLVPSPQVAGRLRLADGTEVDTIFGMSNEVPVMLGVIQSFYDAPGYAQKADGTGLEYIGRAYEELCEYNLGVGVEYWYNNVFAVRGGYFNETARKGNRKYFSLGAALKYNVFGLDVAYLIPIAAVNGSNPLENTLRFNLTYSF